jgi:meso-butanediol dehydrogenase/(S,S)-butanediol dehydrogenase/diacetyl reductase
VTTTVRRWRIPAPRAGVRYPAPGQDPRQRRHHQLGERHCGFRQRRVAAAKAGQIALSQNYAARYGRLGVRFNVVAPGAVRTPSWGSQPNALETLKAMYPLGRLGEPEDIAAAVAFLGSDDAAWITRHTLPVQGGVLTGPGLIDLSPPSPFHTEF